MAAALTILWESTNPGRIARTNRATNTISPFRPLNTVWQPWRLNRWRSAIGGTKKSPPKGPNETACQPAAGSALLLGETMIGWRVWDVMRCVDWIGTRPELDSARVGCMGISGGGTCTLFSAALDTRIKAAFVSGYLNTFRDSIMSVPHCIDNYVPGILNWAENYDVAGLIAPRPLFSEGGDHDPIFPVAATRESFARLKKVYEVFEAGPRAQQEIFQGEHAFHGARGLPFLVEALS